MRRKKNHQPGIFYAVTDMTDDNTTEEKEGTVHEQATIFYQSLFFNINFLKDTLQYLQVLYERCEIHDKA